MTDVGMAGWWLPSGDCSPEEDGRDDTGDDEDGEHALPPFLVSARGRGERGDV